MEFAVSHRAHFEVMWRNDLLRRDDPACRRPAKRRSVS